MGKFETTRSLRFLLPWSVLFAAAMQPRTGSPLEAAGRAGEFFVNWSQIDRHQRVDQAALETVLLQFSRL